MALLSMALLRSLVSATAFLSFSLFLSAATAQTETSELTGLTLSERMDGLESLSGKFQQHQYSDEGALLASFQGNFQIVMPGKVRWETLDPMPQLLVSDGGRYWLHDPDLDQVTTGSLDSSLQMAPAILFSGDTGRLQNEYEILQLSDGLFQLRPKIENSLFKHLELSFDKTRLEGFSMFDHMGQRTEFQLLETQQNMPVDAETFVFQVPQGSDVIYQ
jgi:outer membrane lipoprotein carrier protein